MDTQSAGEAIQGFADRAMDYALVLAAVGTITMALLELAKSLFDARLRFHRQQLTRWMDGKRNESAQRELIALATGAEPGQRVGRGFVGYLVGRIATDDVIYDQPTEKMLGQIQAAANLIMDFPHLYTRSYAFLVNMGPTPGSPFESINGAERHKGDAHLWLEYARHTTEAGATTEHDDPDPELTRRATQARARLGNVVARKLDAFQTQTTYLWAEYNQRVSFVVGGGILLVAIWPGAQATALEAGRALLFAALGGLVAPFAKDVVSALSGLSTKRR